MKCEACETNNPDNSKFCVECGILLKKESLEKIDRLEFQLPVYPEIKDEDRLMSKQEFKDRAMAIVDVPKSVRAQKQVQEWLKEELQKWRTDPWYMPILMSPTMENKVKFEPIPPSDIQIDQDGNCTHDKDFKCGLKDNCNLPFGSENKSLVNVEDKLRSIIPNVPNVNHMYGKPTMDLDKCFCSTADQKYVHTHTSKEPQMCITCGWKNKKHPANIPPNADAIVKKPPSVEDRLRLMAGYKGEIVLENPCGICGTTNCKAVHIPSIQQQYQDTFENIQKIRRKRIEKWEELQWKIASDLAVARAVNEPSLYSLGWLLKNRNKPFASGLEESAPISKITGTDVRKGIGPKKPKEPFASIPIRKGLDRKKRASDLGKSAMRGMKPEKASK